MFAARAPAVAVLLALALAACQQPQTATPAKLPDFADLVEAVSPEVVNISTIPKEGTAPAPAAQSIKPGNPSDNPEGDDTPEWMHKFLAPKGQKEPGAESPGEEDPAEGGDESLGSGFILWADGYVLTNAHVVKDAEGILVRLSDHRELPAQLIGLDEPSDLALLKIDAKGLPAVKIGDPNKLRAGQWVMAIGSPFGFDYSVTAGIVSAKGRNLFTEQYVPFIQTDAAINPGNSGGPLFNLNGEVIGVNSQIYSQTGGNSGIAFAIPMDVAVKVATQLREKGKVTRGWLGVVVQQVTRELAKSFGLNKAEGALVARVVPGSPAELAGVRAGDVILSFNDTPLNNSGELPPLVGSIDPGAKIGLKLLRDGKPQTLTVHIVELPADALKASTPQRAILPLGLAVRVLTPEERAAAKVIDGGVFVLGVEPGPAQSTGVRVGDILLTLQGQQIDSADRLKDAVTRLTPGTSVPMLVQRNGGPLFLALDVPAGE